LNGGLLAWWTIGMKDNFQEHSKSNGSAEESREHREDRTQPAQSSAIPNASASGSKFYLPLDPIRWLEAMRANWYWIFLSGVLFSCAGAAAGFWRFENKFAVEIQLIRRELPNSFRASDVGEAFKPRQLSTPTITSMLRSSTLLQNVARKASPPISTRQLQQCLRITPEKNTDLIRISMENTISAKAVTDLVNLYGSEAVLLIRSLQTQEAVELSQFLKKQLTQTEKDIYEAQQELLAFSRDSEFISADKEADAYLRSMGDLQMKLETARIELETIDFRIKNLEKELRQQDPAVIKLRQAKEELESILLRYTDANPIVKEQKTKIKSFEEQLANETTNTSTVLQAPGTTLGNSLYLDIISLKAQKESMGRQVEKWSSLREESQRKLSSLPEKSIQYARIKARADSLETTRMLLAGRHREAELFEKDDTLAYYRVFAPASVADVSRTSRQTKVMVLALAGFVGGAGLALMVLLAYIFLDKRIITGGDLRACLRRPLIGTLDELNAESSESLHEWAFRTWAAFQGRCVNSEMKTFACGFISTCPGEGKTTLLYWLGCAAAQRGHRVLISINASIGFPNATFLSLQEALENPQTIELKLLQSTGKVVALVEPSDWEWTLERRQQLKVAIAQWQSLAPWFFLCELPSKNKVEAALLAETFSNVIWIAASGKTRYEQLIEAKETMGNAACSILGGILNRMPGKWHRYNWLDKLLPILLFVIGQSLMAQPRSSQSHADEAVPVHSGLFSGVSMPQPAPWQQHLTLGPGDGLNFSIYGRKDLTRNEIFIGPDGRVSFLEVQDFYAAGLTIDELRQKMDEELSRYYRNVRTIITPFAFRSKKYFLLGTIMDRGAYPLDRPLTIIEAVARARGFATGLYEQNTVELADLPRTFLIRQGKRMSVDFEKLFQQGDLSQNIRLEPGDYIYFPSASVNEVYVLGEIRSPGVIGITAKATALSVITVRGGFTPKAYKQKVLVVRGSLDRPESTVVDAAAILAGKAKDFPLIPKDIIYVANRPWSKAEELLDLAASAFIQAATANWTSANIGPLITEPILPALKDSSKP